MSVACDVSALKVSPHRGHRNGQPSIREAAAREQKAEIVLNKEKRNRAEGQNCETQQVTGKADLCNRQLPPSRQRPEGALHFGEGGKSQAWLAKRHNSSEYAENGFEGYIGSML
jgi:hypothetical protein